MSVRADDTLLDSLAAEVRSHPPLDAVRVDELLAGARINLHGEATTALVEHHLFLCLEAALARSTADLDVADLFQEASVALVAAIGDYARGGGPGTGLRGVASAAIAAHLDGYVTATARRHRDDETFLRDSRLYAAVELELRRRLGRAPVTAEIAELLTWEAERVTLMAALLADASAERDASLVPFLDDLDETDGRASSSY